MSGPQNFLARIHQELSRMDLPAFDIINPHPDKLVSLQKPDIFKLGRLNGSYFSRVTPRDFVNMMMQRRGEKAALALSPLRYMSDGMTTWMTKPLMHHLNRASREVQQKSDAIIFQSELSKKMQERFVGRYFENKPHKIVLNGAPLDTFVPGKAPYDLEGYPAIAITASFRPGKRLIEGIRLVEHLKEIYPDVHLHIFGTTDILVEKALVEKALPDVTFHGAVKTEDLISYYAGCDIGISVSLFDPCPNSVVEMLACGLPVLVNSASGAAELVDNPDMIANENIPLDYMEYQTVEALPKIDLVLWREKIIYLLEHREEFAQKARARAEEALDIRLIAAQYAEVIAAHAH